MDKRQLQIVKRKKTEHLYEIQLGDFWSIVKKQLRPGLPDFIFESKTYAKVGVFMQLG